MALEVRRNGRVYLDFDREAFSLEEAVVSAIKDIQSSSVNADVISVAPENLVTETEIAKRLNISRQTVSLWIKGERRKSFPHPAMRLTEKSPLWNWSEVVNWLYENKIVNDRKLVENAFFLANINAALEERDTRTRELRHTLLQRISFQDMR
jgi:predicted DNA-binding transcriptional regulator AlpA